MPWRITKIEKLPAGGPSTPYCARISLENTTTRAVDVVDTCSADVDFQTPENLLTFLCDNGYTPNDLGVCP